jgi:hypothetical protein
MKKGILPVATIVVDIMQKYMGLIVSLVILLAQNAYTKQCWYILATCP